MDLKAQLAQLNRPCEWVALRYVSEETTYRHVRDGHPQSNHINLQQGTMVEVLHNGCFSYAATTGTDIAALQYALDRAVKKAELLEEFKLFNFTQQQRPANQGHYKSDIQISLDELSLTEITDRLVTATHKLNQSDKIVSTHAGIMFTDHFSHYVSTNGADIQQHLSFMSRDLAATAQDGGPPQTRTDFGRGKCLQAGLEILDSKTLNQRCETIGKQALELIDAEECPSEKLDLVLHSDQMLLQIHESIGHPIELDRILGDERNYAGSSFVKLQDFGHLQYGSSLLNVTFDPTITEQYASYGYDDCGAKADKSFIIKDGVLLRGLGSIESQARSGVDGVANFRAEGFHRAPIDRMANLNLEPGSSSAEEIFSRVERGVYMESNRSWSIDDYRNKFQFGCEYAKLIEDGKLTKTLRNPNYRGVSASFWKSLKAVGDQSTFGIFGTPYCGKGEPNQVIRVGHASPMCLFSNIEVFGGA